MKWALSKNARKICYEIHVVKNVQIFCYNVRALLQNAQKFCLEMHVLLHTAQLLQNAP